MYTEEEDNEEDEDEEDEDEEDEDEDEVYFYKTSISNNKSAVTTILISYFSQYV